MPLEGPAGAMSKSPEMAAARTLPALVTPATGAETLAVTPDAALADADDDKPVRQHLFGKMADLLQRTLSRSRENSISLTVSLDTATAADLASPIARRVSEQSPLQSLRLSLHLSLPSARGSRVSLVKETNHVSLEYDPITRRKVLNTYEILREIGRGEHGRVKLARDLVHDELVAIKIVSRKSKRDRRSLRMRRPSNMPPNAAPHHHFNAHETKIRREIAILKRCDHKNIVRLREVLDDVNLYKIYLVLEYLDRGEIKWKRKTPIESPRPLSDVDDQRLPCCTHQKSLTADEDNEMLSDEFSPNLTFRQSRRIFRDVLLGLEYLHMQGIVHRDIKPANLLVSLDYVVKISDFGVSFASSLGSADDGVQFNEMELAKTVGTPAFFAPELCRTNFSSNNSNASMATDMSKSPSGSLLPPVNHKIDIWALGVTLFCLLFGKVPFNAESEFKLFDVIVNEDLKFPAGPDSFHSPQEVTSEEFESAKDLLRRMLDKDSNTRIDIPEIKQHPFVLMDLEDDVEKLNELFFFNTEYISEERALNNSDDRILQDEIDNAVVGVGARVRTSILKAMKTADSDALRKLLLKMESSFSTASSSDDSSHINSQLNLNAQLNSSQQEHSVILSEALLESTSRNDTDYFSKNLPTSHHSHFPHIQSHLSQPPQLAPNQSPIQSNAASFLSRSSVVRNNYIFLDVIESPGTSRKGSVVGILEVPQIETKRNVGGDLYMKNQSAIDAFKDIQSMDQKRRQLSVFTAVSHNSSLPTSTRSPDEPDTDSASTSSPVNIVRSMEASSKIKVGPISIDKNRRPSSVISLPLTESFASLDSLNDDYLSLKYMEFRKQKRGLAIPGVNNSESALPTKENPDLITEKFRTFNLGSLMVAASPTNANGNGNEDIAPHAIRHSSSRSLSCSSASSSYSGSSSDSDEEAGNLTLKFSSKIAPKSRPPFLTLSNRAHSHESNLPNLIHQQNHSNYYDVPIVFQDHLVELEDVPVDLMGPNRTDGNGFDAADMTPTVSALTGIPSSATIIQDSQNSKISTKGPAYSSPLRREITADSPNNSVERMSSMRQVTQFPPRSPREAGYFNNHYKKESTRMPFPFANHLDADRESASKRELKELQKRPTTLRSNSITVGVLQRDRCLKEGE